jgi:hypothetical protein
MEEELGSYIEDIVEHGVDAGYPNLSYYSDTIKLYDKYNEEIWDALYEDYESFGDSKHVLELISKFNIADNVNDDASFKNLLVWYMAERTAREIMDEREEEDED